MSKIKVKSYGQPDTVESMKAQLAASEQKLTDLQAAQKFAKLSGRERTAFYRQHKAQLERATRKS